MRTITLPATATMATIATIHEDLCAAFAGEGAIQIDAGAVTHADFSLIQVLASARAQATRDQRAFTLAAPATGSLAAVLAQAGVPAESPADATFWFHGDAVP